MKYLSIIMIILVSTSVFASEYYDSRINTYDPLTGLYYKAVEESPSDDGFLSRKTTRNVVINIAIYDPTKNTSSLLFKEPQKDGISIVLFETGFKEGKIEFNDSTYSAVVLNNTNIVKREPKNKLLIGVRSKDLKETTLFVSDKRGGNLKKLVTIPFATDWHIDAKNSMLRVVYQTGKDVRIENYMW